MNRQEDKIMENFIRNKNHSMKILAGLFRGSYGKLSGSMFFFVIKHSPVWVILIATAGIIDAANYSASRCGRWRRI